MGINLKIPQTLLALSILGIIFNITDTLTTYISVELLNKLEANPVMAFLIQMGIYGYLTRLIVGIYVFLPTRYTFFHLMKYLASKNKYSNILIASIYTVWAILSFLFLYVTMGNIFVILGMGNVLPMVYG